MVWGDHRQAIEHADRALALAAQLGLPEPARALGFRGAARVRLGDAGGLEDMRTALAAATAQGLGRDVAILYNNLAEATWLVEGPRQRLELAREGARFARRRGIEEVALCLDAITVGALADLGCPGGGHGPGRGTGPAAGGDRRAYVSLLEVRSAQLWALSVRGEHEAATALGQWIVERAREYANPETLASAYPPAAALRVAQGDAPRRQSTACRAQQRPRRPDDGLRREPGTGSPRRAGGRRTRPGGRTGRRSPAQAPTANSMRWSPPGPCSPNTTASTPKQRPCSPTPPAGGSGSRCRGSTPRRCWDRAAACSHSRQPAEARAAAAHGTGHLRLARRQASPDRRRPAAGTSHRGDRIAVRRRAISHGHRR